MAFNATDSGHDHPPFRFFPERGHSMRKMAGEIGHMTLNAPMAATVLIGMPFLNTAVQNKIESIQREINITALKEETRNQLVADDLARYFDSADSAREQWYSMSHEDQEMLYAAYEIIHASFEGKILPSQELDAAALYALLMGETQGESLTGQAGAGLVTVRRTEVDLFERFGETTTDQAFAPFQYEWLDIQWLRDRILVQIQNTDPNSQLSRDLAELSVALVVDDEQLFKLVANHDIAPQVIEAIVEAEERIGSADHYYNPNAIDFTPRFARRYEECGTIENHQFHSSTSCANYETRIDGKTRNEVGLDPLPYGQDEAAYGDYEGYSGLRRLDSRKSFEANEKEAFLVDDSEIDWSAVNTNFDGTALEAAQQQPDLAELLSDMPSLF